MRAAYASDADFELADASAQEIATMTAAMLERARVRALALYVCQRMGFNLENQVVSLCSSLRARAREHVALSLQERACERAPVCTRNAVHHLC